MKKIKYLVLLCTLSFFLTGCVKYNATMNIKKDKSMDFSIIYAFDTSLFGDEELLEDGDKKELEKEGFTIEEYAEDNMKGFKISKNFKNIDDVSTQDDAKYSLSGMLDDQNEEDILFKVKKGLFKNTYTAKFEFDTSDSELNTPTDDTDLDTSDNDWNNADEAWPDDSADDFTGDDTSFDDMDFDMSSLDLSFKVTLPNAAIKNNATSVNNDAKELTWDLTKSDDSAIEFEFYLYNMPIIYSTIGIGAALIILVIAFIISNNKRKYKKLNIEPNVNNSQTPVMNNTLNENQKVQ